MIRFNDEAYDDGESESEGKIQHLIVQTTNQDTCSRIHDSPRQVCFNVDTCYE